MLASMPPAAPTLISIAVDVDGGDHGARVTMAAAAEFLAAHADAALVLVGLESSLNKGKSALARFADRVHYVIANEVVGMDESPASALKNKKQSSMRLAINAVKEGAAVACVSAGNTGALMATARFVLKTLPGIDRPAIASMLPTDGGGTAHRRNDGVLMLDLGANVDCSAEHLRQFAIMGAALSSALTGEARPKVALLNIGEEDIKGNEIVKAAAELIRATDLNFIGNVEGTDVYRGVADVVVCDGFVGNVALKVSEGIAKLMGQMLKEEFSRNVLTQASALLAMPVLKRFKARMDPARHNGATLLGLRGIVIKSHGSAEVLGFRTALKRAYDEAKHDLIHELTERVRVLNQTPMAASDEANV